MENKTYRLNERKKTIRAGRECDATLFGAFPNDCAVNFELSFPRRLAVTETPLYRYWQNPASATRRYMKNIVPVLDRYMEAKEELDRTYEFHKECPRWRVNTRWANLLIAIGNEYAPGVEKPFWERRETVEALCRRPDMREAIRHYKPAGMGRNKAMVAFLVRHNLFGLLTLLYRFKNRM